MNAHKMALSALEMAVRQNGHDMLMTGEELRQCDLALAALDIEAANALKAVQVEPVVVDKAYVLLQKQYRELDAELGDAKIAIQSSMSCTTHYSDLLKTCETERDALRFELDGTLGELVQLKDDFATILSSLHRLEAVQVEPVEPKVDQSS